MLDSREEVLADRPLPREKSDEFSLTRMSQVKVDACKCCFGVASDVVGATWERDHGAIEWLLWL